MEKPKQVTELDLGETLIIQGAKVHVNIDNTTIVAENGVLRANLPQGSPVTQFDLSPTGTLTLGVRGVDQPFTVDLTGLVPTAQADRFLSGVTFSEEEKAFVFTTSKEGEEDRTFKVPLSAFLSEVLKISATDGNILELREDGLYVACCGGGSLGNVPEKPFEVGSKILAFDANGQLYQFAQNAAYEKDVAVAIQVVSNSILDNGDNVAEVQVIVSNNLRTQADNIGLNVGTVADVQSGEISPEAFSLAGNSQKVFTYSVSYNTSSYVTASVSAVGDAVSSNNSASVALPFNVRRTPTSAENTYTEECPLVTATYNGEALIQCKQSPTASVPSGGLKTNVIADVTKPSLAGVTINLQGASRVEVRYQDQRHSVIPGGNNYAITKVSDTEFNAFLISAGEAYSNTNDYTFDPVSGDLTFADTFTQTNAYIHIRPRGENCMWQSYVVVCNGAVAHITEEEQKLATSALPEDVVEYELASSDESWVDRFNQLSALVPSEDVKYFGDITGAKHIGDKGYWEKQSLYPLLRGGTQESRKRLVVKLCERNLPVTFDVNTSSHLPLTQGNVAVAHKAGNVYTVTVSANATATDNYTHEAFKLVIGECSNVVSGTYELDNIYGGGGVVD